MVALHPKALILQEATQTKLFTMRYPLLPAAQLSGRVEEHQV